MKGNEAEYTIGLKTAFLFPPKKRIRKALNVINRFVKKHSRAEKILVSNEVNEFLHKNSKNIPRRVKTILLKREKTVTVYLQNGKQLKAYKESQEKEKKEKTKKKEAVKGSPVADTRKGEGEKEKAKEAKAAPVEVTEQKEKLEEKKAKEKAAKASEMKRK